MNTVLGVAHHIYCRDTGCFDGDDIDSPELREAVIRLVIAELAAVRDSVAPYAKSKHRIAAWKAELPLVEGE